MPLRWALALFGLGLGLPLALRVWLGLWGAMGTDAALWGGSALDLAAGNPVLVPPAYPALIAILRALGVETVPAGWAFSTLAAAAVPVLVALLGRRWGLSPGLTALGALLVMVHPELLTLAQQVQPDALLWAALLGLALLLDDDAPRPAWGAAVLAGLLPLLREHGLPLGLLTGLVLGLRRRWGPLGLLGLLALVGPLPFGGGLGSAPWSERAGGALAALRATRPDELPFLHELHRGDRLAYLGLVEAGDRLGQLAWHARRSLSLAGEVWAALGLALLVAPTTGRGWRAGGPRMALLLGAAALPALVIWSQRRHVSLLIPLLVPALLSAVQGGGWRRGLGLCGLGVGLLGLGRWTDLVVILQQERPRALGYAEVGAWICAQPEPALIGGVHQDLALYCPRRRHDPDGSSADAFTLFIGDVRRSPPPTAVVLAWEAGFSARGLTAWVPARLADGFACQDPEVADGARFIAVGKATATVNGCPPGPPRSPLPSGRSD